MSDKTVIIGNISNTCWVSVDERLPDDKHAEYLWVTKSGQQHFATQWALGSAAMEFTHWLDNVPPPPITKGEILNEDVGSLQRWLNDETKGEK